MLEQNQTFDKVHLPESFYSYSNKEVQNKKGGVILRDKLIKSITKNILGENPSPYLLINQALYQCLMGKQKVVLGEIPEILYRQIVANSLTLDELKDIFKVVADLLEQLQQPISFREGAFNFMPHIFQTPKDLYLTALLKESFQSSTNMVSFIGMHHVRPIQSYWVPPPNGINFTEATRIPDRTIQETDEDLIEKHALLDSLLEQRAWSASYIYNPFPYLTKDITKIDKQTIDQWVRCFQFHYLKYEEFKDIFRKNTKIPFYKNRFVGLLENNVLLEANNLEQQELELKQILNEDFTQKTSSFELRNRNLKISTSDTIKQINQFIQFINVRLSWYYYQKIVNKRQITSFNYQKIIKSQICFTRRNSI